MDAIGIFKGLNLIEFSDRFKTTNDCLEFLAYHKWKNGFNCINCSNSKYWKDSKKKPLNRVCSSCRLNHSPTSGTLFHMLKFDLRSAFFILFECSTTTKSMSSSMIAKRFTINPKTSWNFMHKIRLAMESSKKFPLEGDCEMDEFYFGGKEESKTGRGAQRKKKAVVVIEKSGEHGIKRAYVKRIENTSAEEIKTLFQDHVGKSAVVKTDKWSAYTKLSKEFNIIQEKSEPTKNFKLTHRFIQGIKSWIRGIHHQVSDKYYQNYLNEYCYRFNRNNSKEHIFQNLLERMILAKPRFYPK